MPQKGALIFFFELKPLRKMYDVTYDPVFYRKRRAEAFKFVL